MTGRVKIIRVTTEIKAGRGKNRQQRCFMSVGAMFRVWEQMRNTQHCKQVLRTPLFSRFGITSG